MKSMSFGSRLMIAFALIMLPLIGINQASAADGKLRVGIVGLDYKGGASAKMFAAEVEKDLVENLAKDERISTVAIDPALFAKVKNGIVTDGAAVPAEALKDTDILIVAGVWIVDRMISVKLEFIESGTRDILQTFSVHQRKDYSMFLEMREIALKQISAYLARKALEEQAAAQPAPVVNAIHTHGAGIMPVQGGNTAMARRGAMVLAYRDAAERGLGAVVDLAVIPDAQRRQITATVQTNLRNIRVVIDEQQGDVWVTEIEADVAIPEEITKQYPAPGPVESTGMRPAIQPFKRGSINWETGTIVARGYGRFVAPDPGSVAMAKRAARIDAYAVAMEIVQGISFDVDSKVLEEVALHPQRGYRIRALVQGADIVESKQYDQNTWSETIEVPMRGIKGISTAFDDLFRWEPAPVPPLDDEPEPSPEEANTTGLIIDARGKGLLPALCPVVVDESGVVVYGVGGLPPSVMTQRGAAAYVSGDISGGTGAWLGPNPLRIEALRIERRPTQIASASLPKALRLFHPDILIAQAAQTVVLRQGTQPAKVVAAAASGPQKAKVVVTNSTAAQIRRSNKKTNYLSAARVVIITDSMVGATEGRRKSPGGVIKLSDLQ